EPGPGRPGPRRRTTQGCHPCADRARLAAGPEAVDCAHPGYHEIGAPAGESRSRFRGTHARRPPGDRQRRLDDRGARRQASPGRAGADGSLSGIGHDTRSNRPLWESIQATKIGAHFLAPILCVACAVRPPQTSDSSAEVSAAPLRPLLLRTAFLSSSPGRNPTTRIAGTVAISSYCSLGGAERTRFPVRPP